MSMGYIFLHIMMRSGKADQEELPSMYPYLLHTTLHIGFRLPAGASLYLAVYAAPYKCTN